MAWFVLVIYAASHVATFIFVKPDLIKERAKPGKGVDRIDRVIATLGYLGLYPGTYIVAGLDSVRFSSAVSIPTFVQLIAFVVYTSGYVFAFWAVLSNPFFSTFVRIQTDRDHSLVSSGPYALVRHPGYAGALLAHLALPLTLGSFWAFVPAVLGTIFFVLRTMREEQTLRENLAGYEEYQKQVPWRLLPGIW